MKNVGAGIGAAVVTMGLTVAMCVAITYRGMAHCYDIPNIYYKHHAKFTELIYDKIYNNVLQVLCMHFHSRKNPKMCQKIIMWRFIMMHGKMIMIQTRYCLWCMK